VRGRLRCLSVEAVRRTFTNLPPGSDSRKGPLTLAHYRSLDLSPRAGRGETNPSRSRTSFFARGIVRMALKSLPSRGEQERLPCFPSHLSKNGKGERNAGKSGQHLPHLFRMRRRAHCCARRLVGVPLAAPARGTLVPKARVQARLPGTWFRRALPGVSCPSPVAAPHAPVVMPASMMPGPARERSVWLRARAPHPLHLG